MKFGRISYNSKDGYHVDIEGNINLYKLNNYNEIDLHEMIGLSVNILINEFNEITYLQIKTHEDIEQTDHFSSIRLF